MQLSSHINAHRERTGGTKEKNDLASVQSGWDREVKAGDFVAVVDISFAVCLDQ